MHHPSDNLTGHVCQVYSIQESIQSLGGLPVLFPLLEQACFKTNSRSKRLVESQSVKSDSSYTSVSGLENTTSEDIDVVDSRKPTLSDLPVLYSPRIKNSAFSLGADESTVDDDGSRRWTNEMDEELGKISFRNSSVNFKQSKPFNC